MSGAFSEWACTLPIAEASVFLIRTRWPRAHPSGFRRRDYDHERWLHTLRASGGMASCAVRHRRMQQRFDFGPTDWLACGKPV